MRETKAHKQLRIAQHATVDAMYNATQTLHLLPFLHGFHRTNLVKACELLIDANVKLKEALEHVS